MDNKNIINVFYDKERILTIIGNSGMGTDSMISQQQSLNRWIEYGETNPIASVGQFSALWNVPKSPTSIHQYTPGLSQDGTKSMIWDGLETSDGNYLLQPVLEWYARDKAESPYPTTANWSIATWWISPKEYNGNGIHSTRVYGILSGDQILGNIIHSGGTWIGSSTDMNSYLGSSLFLNVSQSKDLTYTNLQAYTVLEGWDPYLLNPQNYDYHYLPGNVTFGSIIIKDIYGNSVIPSSINSIVNGGTWSTTNYGLSVTNSTWPTSIELNTGNV